MVRTTNADIVSVRSVGSNPTNPNSENTTLYTSDFLANNPSNNKGRYNRIGKGTDENYQTDYNRMQELGISKAENGQVYWMASRFVDESSAYVYFRIRDVYSDGTYREYSGLWGVQTSNANGNNHCCGVRPIVSLKSDALSKYLD